MRGPLNRIFATTGSIATQMKIARRYLYALIHHGSIRKYWNFMRVEWARWRGHTTVKGFPYVLKIESTNICNLECPFCLDRDRSSFNQEGMRGFGRMKADAFKEIIDQLKPYAFNVNMYGSGEPLLFPEAYEMMRYAADNDIGVRISSNLSMKEFTEEQCEKILGAGIEHLIVSCHGASQETYEKYMVGGNFERVIKNMRLLVATKKKMGLKTPFIDWQFLIFSHNQHELETAKAMADDIGIDLLRLIYPNIPAEHKEEWKPRDEGEATGYHINEDEAGKSDNAEANGQANGQLANTEANRQANGQAAGKAESNGAAPAKSEPKKKGKQKKIATERCSWPYRSIYFNWDGGILPCCDGTTKPSYDIGKFGDGSDVKEIWNGPDYVKVREYANWKVAPQDMDKRYTCATCLKPLAPFIMHDKGMLLEPGIESQVKATLSTATNPPEEADALVAAAKGS